MEGHPFRVARTIIWVGGVNFDQGKFELPGLYVFVHLTADCRTFEVMHIYDFFSERRQRASRSVRCTALCRRSIFNRRWVCAWLIDYLEMRLGLGQCCVKLHHGIVLRTNLPQFPAQLRNRQWKKWYSKWKWPMRSWVSPLIVLVLTQTFLSRYSLDKLIMIVAPANIINAVTFHPYDS